MADSVATKLPKPDMRGMVRKQIARNLIGCGIVCALSVVYMKFVFGDGNKRRYAEFYKNYDIDKEFNIMRKKGLFQSCSVEDTD